MLESSQETSKIFWGVQKATFLFCDWWILIHFASFCFYIHVHYDNDDDSIKFNRKFGFELQSEFACY